MKALRFAPLCVLVLLGACERDRGPFSAGEGPDERSLQPAFLGEVEVVISVGGTRLNTSIHGTYSASIAPVGTTHGGTGGTKIVTKNPSITQPTLFGCGDCARNVNISDGFENEHQTGDGIIWDGVYTLTITRPSGLGSCPYEVVQNHVDTGGDTFFDATWGDQKLTLNFPTSSGCASANWTNKHSKPASPLSVSISAPTAVSTNQTFTVSASSSGGFGSHRYVPSFNAASTTSVDFAPAAFGTTSSWNHSYSSPGTYTIAVAAKDAGTQGGKYALATRTITVSQATAYDADVVSNTIPSNITTGTVYATSVTMLNVGSQTWSGSSYTLQQINSTNWSPQSVAFGTGSVASGQSKTFNFNLASFSGTFCDWQPNNYRMKKSDIGLFGDPNGKDVFIKCGGSPPPDPFLAPVFSFGGDGRRLFSASSDLSWLRSQGEVIQVDSQENVDLPLEEVLTNGSFTLRYYAALAEEWPVDFHFRIKFDPSIFNVGELKRGIRAQQHSMSVRIVGPGEIIVEGVRVRGHGLNGEGLIFELPLTLKTSSPKQPRLDLIEVVATG